MLRKKNITLNGKKAAGNEILKLNDTVRLFLSDETIQKFSGTIQQSPEIPTGSWLMPEKSFPLFMRMNPPFS